MRLASSCFAAAGLAIAACRDPIVSTSSATVTVATADASSDAGGEADDASGTTLGPLMTTTADIPSSTSGPSAVTGSSGEVTGEVSSSEIPPPACGDGVVAEGLEDCDPPSPPGSLCDYCTADCKRAAYCGDREWQPQCEACDPTAMHATHCDMHCEFSARTVFVTSVKYSGALGGVEGAHALCAERAKKAADAWSEAHPGEPNPWLGRAFRAWISDGGAQNCPAKFLDDSGDAQPRPYHLPGGQSEMVAASTVALADGPKHPIDRDEFGDEIKGVIMVWSNTKADGTPLSKGWDCMQWSLAGPLEDCDEEPERCGAVGRLGVDEPGAWTNAGVRQPCAYDWLRLYCFEQSVHQQKQAEMNAPCPDPG